MKKININLVLFVLCISLLSAESWAANKRCGLGSKFFGKSRSSISQASEIVTNGVSSGPSSIELGTSGCHHDGTLLGAPIGRNEPTEKEVNYADNNYEEIMMEMSAGKGEVLQGFATALGCQADVLPAFESETQRSFQTIFSAEEVSPEEIVSRVKSKIQENQILRTHCQQVLT